MDFYVTLPSNTDAKGNTTAQFRCPLAHTVELTGSWEVCLSEIQYPRTWINLGDGERALVYLTLADTGKMIVRSVKIAKGFYTDVQEIGRKIELAVEKFYQRAAEETENVLNEWNTEKNLATEERKESVMRMVDFYKGGMKNAINFDMTGDRLCMELNKKYIGEVDFSTGLRKLLGFRDNSEGVASHKPNFDGNVSSLFIYTNIIENQLIGNALAPVLKTVAVTGSVGEIADVTYFAPHYVPVLKRSFADIEISINSDQGLPIPFIDDSKVIVKLHFRKRKLY